MPCRIREFTKDENFPERVIRLATRSLKDDAELSERKLAFGAQRFFRNYRSARLKNGWDYLPKSC
jgi:hypothetical protein